MHLLNSLGQAIIPSVFKALSANGIVETVSIRQHTTSTDSGGAVKKGASVVVYEGLPCAVKIKTNDRQRVTSSDKQLTRSQYELTLPRYYNSERIEFDVTKHRIVVEARSDEPQKIYRGQQVRDNNAITFIVVAERENDESDI